MCLVEEIRSLDFSFWQVVVIDDYNLHPEIFSLLYRIESSDAVIDTDDQGIAFLMEFVNSAHTEAISFLIARRNKESRV